MFRVSQGVANGQFLRPCVGLTRQFAQRQQRIHQPLVQRSQTRHGAQTGSAGVGIAAEPVASATCLWLRQRHQPEIQVTIVLGVRVKIQAFGHRSQKRKARL